MQATHRVVLRGAWRDFLISLGLQQQAVPLHGSKQSQKTTVLLQCLLMKPFSLGLFICSLLTAHHPSPQLGWPPLLLTFPTSRK